MIVNFAETSGTALAINEYDYGSLQTVKRARVEAPPSEVDVSLPSFSEAFQSYSEFLWIYLDVSSNSTLLTFRFYDPDVVGKVKDAPHSKTGSWSIITYSSASMLIQEVGTSNFQLARYNASADTWSEEDLSAIMAGITIDTNTNELMSQDGNRIRLNNDLIFFNSGTSQWEFMGGSSGAFPFTALNDNLDTALIGDKIYKYDGASTFTEYGTLSVTLLAEVLLYASGNMVIVASRSSTDVKVAAFNDNGDGTYT